jgi:DNA-binding transcriptional LysR family regulator
MPKRLMPSITALQRFEAAARHLSFTRAAHELHLTPAGAQAGCGIALIPHYLVAEELTEGKLMIAWQHAKASEGSHFIAHANMPPRPPRYVHSCSGSASA